MFNILLHLLSLCLSLGKTQFERRYVLELIVKLVSIDTPRVSRHQEHKNLF